MKQKMRPHFHLECGRSIVICQQMLQCRLHNTRADDEVTQYAG